MSQQRQQDVRIADQEVDYDGPEPVPEFDDLEAARPPLSDYLDEEWMEGDR